MRRPITFFSALTAVVLFALLISGCKKNNPDLALEPISLISPDSVISTSFPDTIISPIVKITTDRPIDWVMCLVDVDTFISSINYVPTYPDTISFKSLQNVTPQVNIYTDSIGKFTIPSLPAYTILRFKVIFQAGSIAATYGQNYPIGLVSDQKEFIVNIQ